MFWKSEKASFAARTLITAVAAAALGGAITAYSQPAAAPTFTAEKCYGIAKAGSNDCASTGNSVCAGTSRVDGDANAWMYMPTGLCNRIVGASLTGR